MMTIPGETVGDPSNRRRRFLTGKPGYAPLVVGLICAATAGLAQERPSAGSILRQTDTTLNGPRTGDTAIATETFEGGLSAEPGGQTVEIVTLRISGLSVFTQAELVSVLGHENGNLYDLAGLFALAERLTMFYREEGYPFAFAYLPPQELTGGVLLIEVLEGRYGAVTTSGPETLARPALRYLDRLQPGAVIRQDALARAILLLGDVPGVGSTPVLSPGSERGTGDLDVEVAETQRWQASIGADNYGNRFSGAYRGRVDLSFSRLLSFGDRVSLSLLRSDEGLTFGDLRYGLPLGNSGLRGEVAMQLSSYALGAGFQGFEGTARTVSARLSFPVIRQVERNLSASLEFANKELDDKLVGVTYDLKTANVLTGTAQFDLRDGLGGGGLTYGSVAISLGEITSTSPTSTTGPFSKLRVDITRQQYLGDGFGLVLRGNGQLAAAGLDSSEQFSLGGAAGVRAYPSGEATASTGGFVQAELRYTYGKYQFFGFYDAGWIAADGAAPARHLSGYGLGIQMNRGAFSSRLVAAWKGVGGLAQSDVQQRSPQIWATLDYRF